MTSRVFIFLVSFLFLAIAPLQAKRFFVSKWLQSFHETQNLEDFDKALIVWRVRETMEDPEARQPVIGFLAYLFANHPETIPQALGDDASKLTAGQKVTFAKALLRAGTNSAEIALRSIGYAELLEKPAPIPISQLKVSQAAEMDLCWGYYFASGDVAAVKPVVDVLALTTFAEDASKFQDLLKLANEADARAEIAGQEGNEREVDKQLLAAKKAREEAVASSFYEGATKFAMFERAQWSLALHAEKNPKLLDFLDSLAKSPDTPQAVADQLRPLVRRLSPDGS